MRERGGKVNVNSGHYAPPATPEGSGRTLLGPRYIDPRQTPISQAGRLALLCAPQIFVLFISLVKE